MILIILQACGAIYTIKGELLDEIDVDDVVVALVELARRVSCNALLFLLFFSPIFFLNMSSHNLNILEP